MNASGKEAASAVQSKALGLLMKFKEDYVGAKIASHERDVDQRFMVATTALLNFLNEDEVKDWFSQPCRCLDCQNSESQLPRIDMINAEVSFRHLMKGIEAERCCHRGPFA